MKRWWGYDRNAVSYYVRSKALGERAVGRSGRMSVPSNKKVCQKEIPQVTTSTVTDSSKIR